MTPKTFLTLSLALALSISASQAAVGFIYHDSATTDGGEFATTFGIDKLNNAEHTSHLGTEDAAEFNESYATANGPTNGYPVTITLDFTEAVNLTNFYLWNHSNNSGAGAPANGVGDFTLTFYDGASGGGSVIGSAFSGLGTAAPATGTYAAQVFTFGTTYANVRSVKFVITDKANNTATGFLAMREIGFEAVPEPSSLMLIGLTLGAFLLKRRR